MRVKTGYLKVFCAALIWGTIGAFVRWSGLPPLELSFFRFLVGGLALFALLPRGQRLIIFHTRHFPLIILSGVLFAADCLLFFYAVRLTTLANAVFPYYIQPVLLALLAPLLFKEKPEARHWVAFLLSLAGVGVLVFPAVINLSLKDLTGIGFGLAGALCLSLVAVIAKVVNIPSATFVYYIMFIAVICLIPFVSITSPLSWQSIAIIAIMGLLHTAAAYIFYYDGLRNASIQYAVTLTYFAPIVAALIGLLLFHEPTTLYTVLGGLLIVINGIFVIVDV